jgi:hypothetical protein
MVAPMESALHIGCYCYKFDETGQLQYAGTTVAVCNHIPIILHQNLYTTATGSGE